MLTKVDLENALKQGFISLEGVKSVRFHLAYATAENFMAKDVYGPHWKALCHSECYEKLIKAHALLQKHNPHYTFLVFDALRPVRSQQILFDFVKGTPQEPYVADPKKGSMHSYGMAVDLTLWDLSKNKEVDMGTPFDDFTELSQPQKEQEYFNKGLLTQTQLADRHILRDVMADAGFYGIPNEWWHFNAEKPDIVRRDYQVFA